MVVLTNTTYNKTKRNVTRCRDSRSAKKQGNKVGMIVHYTTLPYIAIFNCGKICF